MPRASKNSRFPGRRSVSYLIAVGAVGLVGAAPLLSAAPALANPTATVDITVQAGDVAHVTLPGNGNYGLYDVPDCGHASWLGPAYTFDATNCPPHTTVNNLIDWDTDTDITVNITVTPAIAPLALPTTPATPSVFSSIGQLTLTWAAADVAEQVDGYEYTINGGSTWTAGTSGATVTGLTSGTVYQVGVRSHNASGYSLPSAYSPVMTMSRSSSRRSHRSRRLRFSQRRPSRLCRPSPSTARPGR